MAKNDKLIARLLLRPADFTWDELIHVLNYFGYQELKKGKTVGSLAGLGGAAAVFGTIITMFLVPYITAGNNWAPFFVMGALLIPLSIGSVLIFSSKE